MDHDDRITTTIVPILFKPAIKTQHLKEISDQVNVDEFLTLDSKRK